MAALAGGSAPTPARAEPDALHRKVLAELKVFTDWLSVNGVKGYLGEVGWPNGFEIDPDTGATVFRPGESPKWNALAQDWYAAADAANLWVTAFSAGEIMSPDHWLRIYGSSQYTFEQQGAIDTADPSASVVEAHPTTASYARGVHDFGSAICVSEHFGQRRATSFFSNHTPYVYDDHGKHSAKFGENACYHYDTAPSLAFLARHGVKLVRLDFRWERVQPDVGGELRTEDVQHIVDWVHAAEAAGLTPIIDLHNYGHLYIWSKRLRRGVRTAIGSGKLPVEAYADLWARLSAVFKDEPTVAYDLMNEPEEMDAGDTPGAQVWERASQAAVDAIRANGDNHLLMVEGYDFAPVERWSDEHPRAWISDPADNFRYEGHHYWDRDASGYYSHTYDEEVADAAAKGF